MKKGKRIVIVLLAAVLLFGLTACGGENAGTADQSEAVQPSAEQEPGTDTLVVYFSATGTTKGVAEKIAALTDADLAEIVPAEPYTDADLNYQDESSRATREQQDPDARPALGGEDISLSGYDTLFIGYPIWWGDAPRVMSSFVESHDFDGLRVIPFCTSGSSEIGESAEHLAAQAESGDWLPGQRFSAETSEADLREWLDHLP